MCGCGSKYVFCVCACVCPCDGAIRRAAVEHGSNTGISSLRVVLLSVFVFVCVLPATTPQESLQRPIAFLCVSE